MGHGKIPHLIEPFPAYSHNLFLIIFFEVNYLFNLTLTNYDIQIRPTLKLHFSVLHEIKELQSLDGSRLSELNIFKIVFIFGIRWISPSFLLLRHCNYSLSTIRSTIFFICFLAMHIIVQDSIWNKNPNIWWRNLINLKYALAGTLQEPPNYHRGAWKVNFGKISPYIHTFKNSHICRSNLEVPDMSVC